MDTSNNINGAQFESYCVFKLVTCLVVQMADTCKYVIGIELKRISMSRIFTVLYSEAFLKVYFSETQKVSIPKHEF